jgi:predicted nucleotidyltransferase
MDDVVYVTNYKNASASLSRAISEPDFANINDDSGIESGDSNHHESAGIFERPGFGTVSFMSRPHTSGALMSLPWDNQIETSDEGQGKSVEADKDKSNIVVNGKSSAKSKSKYKSKTKGIPSFRRKGSISDSIGTLGSLAVRIKDAHWDESDVDLLDDDDIIESTPLELFLTSNGLTEFLSNFTKEKIDLKAAALLSDADLKELGLPLGPRRKFLEAIGRRKSAVKNPGIIYDTRL